MEIVVYIVLAAIAIPALLCLDGWVVSTTWNWFVVPLGVHASSHHCWRRRRLR